MNSIEVFNEFVNAINQRDVDHLCRLMTVDHLFVDSLGMKVRGRDVMRQGWGAYFSMVPDYAIEVKETIADGQLILATGIARGTYSPDGKLRLEDSWSTPAAWRAIVEREGIAIWQVYADNEPMRMCLRKYAREKA